MIPDGYIYDSQFMFLPEQTLLAKEYEKKVLGVLQPTSIDETTAYFAGEKWDSEKFGVNVGRLYWLENNIENPDKMKRVLTSARQYKVCYVRLNRDHSFCLQSDALDLKPLACKVSQHINLKSSIFGFDRSLKYEKLEDSNNQDRILEEIFLLSENAFQYSRFHSDPFFDKKLIDGIYTSWISNEIKEKKSELFFVRANERVRAFFLYKKNISPISTFKIGFVSLIASDAEYRGKKLAGNLLNYVLNIVKEEGADYVVANTELRNESALAFFKGKGFKQTALLNEYHIWN